MARCTTCSTGVTRFGCDASKRLRQPAAAHKTRRGLWGARSGTPDRALVLRRNRSGSIAASTPSLCSCEAKFATTPRVTSPRLSSSAGDWLSSYGSRRPICDAYLLLDALHAPNSRRQRRLRQAACTCTVHIHRAIGGNRDGSGGRKDCGPGHSTGEKGIHGQGEEAGPADL